MATTDPVTGRSRGYAWVAAANAANQTIGARRDVPADGADDRRVCPVNSIRKAYCPVSPLNGERACTGKHATRESIKHCAVRA